MDLILLAAMFVLFVQSRLPAVGLRGGLSMGRLPFGPFTIHCLDKTISGCYLYMFQEF